MSRNNDDTQPLMRLRYGGSAARWGFAIYLASKDGYETSSCRPASSPVHPKTPWTPPAASTSATPPPGSEPPTNSRAGPLRKVLSSVTRQALSLNHRAVSTDVTYPPHAKPMLVDVKTLRAKRHLARWPQFPGGCQPPGGRYPTSGPKRPEFLFRAARGSEGRPPFLARRSCPR
jgi:hypothetical protein